MPVQYNFDFVRGDTFNLKFNFKDSEGDTQDLSGWSARMKIRKKSDNTLIAEYSDGDGITLSATSPNVSIIDDDTAAWPLGAAVYDLELTSNGSPAITTTNPQGVINVVGDVTD